MGFGRRKLTAISVLVLIGFFTVLPFQACSQIGFDSKKDRQGDLGKGGEGFDGKPYLSYGPCGGEIGVSEIVMVASDFKSASLTRENCSDLIAPQALPIDDLKFSYRDAGVFEMKGKVFDEQVASGDQKVTSFVCNSVGSVPAVQSLIWTNASGILMGSVSQSNGVLSGPLSVQAPAASSPDRYVTSSGQSSQFDLNIGGALTYSIGGGPSESVPQVMCSTQAPPVALVQRAAGASSGSGVTYRLNTAATQSGHLLVVGLSIFDTGASACTIAITDNAPGGGNVYASAGAFATDSASGSADVWYAANSRPGATSLTITLDSRCSGRRPAAYFAEFSGVALSNPLDGVAALSGQPASTSVTAPQVATGSDRTVVFSVTSVQFDVTGTQNAFTALPIVDGDSAAYRITTSTGSYGAVWNQNNSGSYGASTVSFKAAW